MTTKTISEGIDETLKNEAQHGQPEHGRKEIYEDIVEGAKAKTRDVKSPQIRGEKINEKRTAKIKLQKNTKKNPTLPNPVNLAEKQKRNALSRWENEGGPPDEREDSEQ